MSRRLHRSRALPRLLWLATVAVAPVSRRAAGRLVAGLWFVPWTATSTDAAPPPTLGPARHLTAEGHDVAVHVAGAGPTVLLVHGWADRSASLVPLAEALIAAGRRVVAVDLPAHGAAPGVRTDLLAWADALADLTHRFEPRAVVAHSLGATATAAALRRHGLNVPAVMLLAPVVRVEHAVATFGRDLRLPPRALAGLRRELERRFGSDVWTELATDVNLCGRGVRIGIVHDVDDRRVAVGDARMVREHVGGHVDLIETTGLGHSRLLRDADVIAHVVATIVAAERDAAGSSGAPPAA